MQPTLKSADLKNGAAVRSSDVIDGTIQSEDVSDSTLLSEDYQTASVESIDIGADAVRGSEIATGAVGTSEILDLNVGNADLGFGAVKSANVANNAVGSGDLATITAVVDPTPFDFADQDEGNNDYVYGTSIVDCPGGSTVIGGGAKWVGAGFGGAGGDELQAITESKLASNGWIATAVSDVDNQDFTAIAYCLSTGA
ncbi:MAG: hypothetical protein ABI726_10105 [bacterium]